MQRALVWQALSETMCWGAAAVAGEDIQDLTVMSQPPPGQQKNSVPDDPAIISAVSSAQVSQLCMRITHRGHHGSLHHTPTPLVQFGACDHAEAHAWPLLQR
jgi:hypothetical protein